MMLYLYVLQNQWIVMTLLAGIALTLIFCLTYSSMWRQRAVEGKSEEIKVKDLRSFFAWIFSFVPWVVILIVLACVAFTIATVMEKSCIPPNW